jgi:hypothetical protein
MSSFREIIKNEFLSDPTDPTIATIQFEETRTSALAAVRRNDMESYWELTRQMKIIGKMLPITDERNPDHVIYTGQQGSDTVE